MTKYEIIISAINGNEYICSSHDKADVLDFTRNHDHEGASKILIVEYHDEDEDIYKLLGRES